MENSDTDLEMTVPISYKPKKETQLQLPNKYRVHHPITNSDS